MRNFKDITGEKFSRLTVLEYAGVDKFRLRLWKCRCDCGNEIITAGARLRNGQTKSCGCLQKENFNCTKHNMSRTRPYVIWGDMKHRCYYVKDKRYNDYGGRGIKICDRWLHSFENFWEDMQEGYSDNLSIDRINVNGNYEPNNVKWSTCKQQSNNMRSNVVVEFNHIKHTVSEWSTILGIKQCTLRKRLYRGWSVERAFTTIK